MAITIFQQPINTNYMSPNTVSLTVGASSNNNAYYITYQWQTSPDGSTGWADIPNSTAVLPKLTLSQNDTPIYGEDRWFRAVIKEFDQGDVQRGTDTSTVVKLTVFRGRTNANYTKSRENADNWANKANHIEALLDPSITGIFTGGTTNLGHPTLDDASNHITYHNVQSALIDLATALADGVGTVKMTATKIDPSGAPQQTVINFSGTVVAPNGASVALNIFGKKVTVSHNAIAATVRDQIFNILTGFEAAGLYIKDVAKSGAEGIQFTHRDNKPWLPTGWTQHGITMTGVVASPARYGYGQWVQLGDPISQGGKQVYYWERVA